PNLSSTKLWRFAPKQPTIHCFRTKQLWKRTWAPCTLQKATTAQPNRISNGHRNLPPKHSDQPTNGPPQLAACMQAAWARWGGQRKPKRSRRPLAKKPTKATAHTANGAANSRWLKTTSQ